MKPARFVAIGALGLFWCVAVFGFGVFLSRNSNGENFGKLIGTLISGVAFVPPVLVFMRWYRATEGDSIGNRPHTSGAAGGSGVSDVSSVSGVTTRPSDPADPSSGGDTP
jgi:hypothetical protein